MSSSTPLADQVSMLARLTRSGSTLNSAVNDVAHRYPASLFHNIAIVLARGGSLAEATTDLSPRDGDERLVVVTLDLAARMGGDVSSQLDSLVEVLSSREQARTERRAHASTALASTRLLTLMPPVVVAFIALDDHHTARLMFTSTPGVVCVLTGLAFNLAGRVWTRRIILGP